MMESDADSAMKVLGEIGFNEIPDDSHRARYQLLKFAISAKTGNLPDSDSLLVLPRMQFVGTDKFLRERMLTHFFTAYYLSFHNHYDEAIKEYREAVVVGDRLGENVYTGMALTNIGAIYGTKWVGREELKFTKEGLDRIRLTDDSLRIANAYNEYGIALMHSGNHKAADKSFESAMLLYESINNYNKVAEVLRDAGFNASQMNEDEKTLRYYSMADSIERGCFKATDHGIVAHALINLERYEEARGHINRMKTMLEDAADTVLWCYTSWNLAKSTGHAGESTFLVDSLINISNAVINNVLNTNPLYSEKDQLETDLSVYRELARRRTIITILCVLLGSVICGFLVYVIVTNYRSRKRERILHVRRIRSLQNRITSYEDDLAKREYALSVMQDTKESLERSLKELKDKLQDMATLLSHRDSLLNQAESDIKQYESIIADIRECIDGKDRIIAFKESLLKEKEAMLKEQKSLMKDQKSLFEAEREILNKEIERTGLEAMNMEKNLKNATDSIEKLEGMLKESRCGYNRMMSEILESDGRNVDSKSRLSLDAQKNVISDRYRDKKTIACLEKFVNENMENILSLIDNDQSVGEMDEESRLILIYTLSGFSYRAISCLLGKNQKTVSAMKSNLIRKLVTTVTVNHDVYLKYLKGMTYSKRFNK